MLDAIRTDLDNGVWDISFDRCLSSHKTVEVYMTVPELTSVELIGSGKVELQDAFEVDEFRAAMEGSGSLSIDVVAAKVTSRLSGSGTIDLRGAAPVQEVSVSGSGKTRAFDLITENTGVVLSGSGEVEVHAANNLSVSISGSGNVYYQSNPSINSTISGSGRVIKR